MRRTDCEHGLSPPTRGNRVHLKAHAELAGSIPAHAGEPPPCAGRGRRGGVYPRPRGGTTLTPPLGADGNGLSPPTRGNHAIPTDGVYVWRSIPAHAGEPCYHRRLRRRKSVYPRPRGGTPARARADETRAGLSPPTRGNLLGERSLSDADRSIPAHAGEPPNNRLAGGFYAVYPRPRGGTANAMNRL